MEPRLIFGLGISAISLFGRWLFPTVPKPIGWAGLISGLGLVGLSFMPGVRGGPAVLGLCGIAAMTSAVAWQLTLPSRVSPNLHKPQSGPSKPLEAHTDTPNKKASSSQGGDTYNVTNSGSGVSIGRVDTLNLGPAKFEMSAALMSDVAEKLGKPRPISLFAVGGQASQKAVQALGDFLSGHGFTVTVNWIGALSPPLDQPIELRNEELYIDAGK